MHGSGHWGYVLSWSVTTALGTWCLPRMPGSCVDIQLGCGPAVELLSRLRQRAEPPHANQNTGHSPHPAPTGFLEQDSGAGPTQYFNLLPMTLHTVLLSSTGEVLKLPSYKTKPLVKSIE